MKAISVVVALLIDNSMATRDIGDLDLPVLADENDIMYDKHIASE